MPQLGEGVKNRLKAGVNLDTADAAPSPGLTLGADETNEPDILEETQLRSILLGLGIRKVINPGDQTWHFCHVLLDCGAERWLVQGSGRMVHGVVEDTVNLARLAVNLGDFGVRKVASHRKTTQGNDDFGPDECNLPVQVISARFYLI